MADDRKVIGRPFDGKEHTGKPFGAGNPGRPKGARSRISESFLKAMADDFDKHGVATIERVRDEDPSTYLKIVAGLLPKELTGEGGESLFSGITVNFVRPGDRPKS